MQMAPRFAPGAIDPRWAPVIADAYREAIIRLARHGGGGLLFQILADGRVVVMGAACAEIDLAGEESPR